jgi:hypothetical protein
MSAQCVSTNIETLESLTIVMNIYETIVSASRTEGNRC